jgi:hypothetical protein
VRHIYDLHVIREHYDAADVAALAREIMRADAETYGHQFPAYRDDPLDGELSDSRLCRIPIARAILCPVFSSLAKVFSALRAIEGIAADRGFAASYATFRRDMVYGEGPDFETAIATRIARNSLSAIRTR